MACPGPLAFRRLPSHWLSQGERCGSPVSSLIPQAQPAPTRSRRPCPLACMASSPTFNHTRLKPGARRLQKSNTWRLRRDDAPATGGVGTPEEDCRRQPAGRSRREAASQSGSATTSASVMGTPRVVATSLLLRQGYGGQVLFRQGYGGHVC